MRTIITDEMLAPVIDYVIVHGMTMAEAALRVHQNHSENTTGIILCASLLDFYSLVEYN